MVLGRGAERDNSACAVLGILVGRWRLSAATGARHGHLTTRSTPSQASGRPACHPKRRFQKCGSQRILIPLGPTLRGSDRRPRPRGRGRVSSLRGSPLRSGGRTTRPAVLPAGRGTAAGSATPPWMTSPCGGSEGAVSTGGHWVLGPPGPTQATKTR